ncbi:MAG: hypothetical protein IKJ32_04550 [Clostridia bacterium]|nr:hypothetical protein [Clostridia bacterium]
MIIWPFLIIGFILSAVMAMWIRDNVDNQTFQISKGMHIFWGKHKKEAEILAEGSSVKNMRIKTIKFYLTIFLLHLFVAFCIVAMGGIIGAEWLVFMKYLEVKLTWFSVIFMFFTPLTLLYALIHISLKLSNFSEPYSHVIFIEMYIISVIYWYGILQGF